MLRSSGLPLYEITGTEIGTGADGEPLLADARIVRRIKDTGWQDVWENISGTLERQTARVYRHIVTGDLQCCIPGVRDIQCKPEEFKEQLLSALRWGNGTAFYAEAIAEKVLAALSTSYLRDADSIPQAIQH